MKIPKRFKLFGHTIEVVQDHSLRFRENCNGEARYRTRTIMLSPSAPNYPRIQSDIEHTFLHELTHWILHELNEIDLRNNEKFVDTFAGLLHQALTTSEYK